MAALNGSHGHVDEAIVEACLAVMLTAGRSAFPLGCSNRPRPAIALAALAAWGLAAGAILSAPAVRHTAGHVLAGVLHHPVAHSLGVASAPRLSAGWDAVIDVLIAGAAAISVLALRSLVRPATATNRHLEHEYRAARAVIDAHGTDSLSPFLLRPDKALAFAAGGVLAYRVIGGTAVISADPVAPDGAAGDVLSTFQDQARRRGWQIVLWGAAETHLEAYQALGLHAMRVGEEAFVDPRTFTLEGRAVRKLRQSVHRVERRGWMISAHDGREIDAWMESEIELVAARWRDDHPHVHGFAMGMGDFTSELRADDLYVLARSPAGELGGVMRFVTCGDSLSLDTMHRVGETPNGLNEALVARALAEAGERGIAEVSLNYAGLAHLIRREPSRNRVARGLTRFALAPLHQPVHLEAAVQRREREPGEPARHAVAAGLPADEVGEARVVEAHLADPALACFGQRAGDEGLVETVGRLAHAVHGVQRQRVAAGHEAHDPAELPGRGAGQDVQVVGPQLGGEVAHAHGKAVHVRVIVAPARGHKLDLRLHPGVDLAPVVGRDRHPRRSTRCTDWRSLRTARPSNVNVRGSTNASSPTRIACSPSAW